MGDVVAHNPILIGSTSAFTYFSQFAEIFRADIQSNDLILLDFSVNDQYEFGMPWNKDLRIIEFGIESLVRHFLALDAAVVLLEHWPLGIWNLSETSYNSASDNDQDYIVPYRRVAKHYRIPVWSYRSSVWDRFVDSFQVSTILSNIDIISNCNLVLETIFTTLTLGSQSSR